MMKSDIRHPSHAAVIDQGGRMECHRSLAGPQGVQGAARVVQSAPPGSPSWPPIRPRPRPTTSLCGQQTNLRAPLRRPRGFHASACCGPLCMRWAQWWRWGGRGACRAAGWLAREARGAGNDPPPLRRRLGHFDFWEIGADWLRLSGARGTRWETGSLGGCETWLPPLPMLDRPPF
jgi:hypothetical protein